MCTIRMVLVVALPALQPELCHSWEQLAAVEVLS